MNVARRWRVRLDEQLKPMNMSQAGWAALHWLGLADERISQAILAERAGIEPPALVRLIDHLEAQSLVERAASPTDRRVNLVQLTDAGRALVGVIEAAAEALHAEVMDGMTLDEFQISLAALRKVRERLE